MRMSAEGASPALVESSGEQTVSSSSVGAAPAAELAVVGQPQADTAMLVPSVQGLNVTAVSSQATATTAAVLPPAAAAEGVATPPLPEEPLQGKDLLEAIKKQVCVHVYFRVFCD